MTSQRETPTCEYLVGWGDSDPLFYQQVRDPVFCGRVAVTRYPAMGGGYMHLCIEHGKKHRDISEPCYDGEHA